MIGRTQGDKAAETEKHDVVTPLPKRANVTPLIITGGCTCIDPIMSPDWEFPQREDSLNFISNICLGYGGDATPQCVDASLRRQQSEPLFPTLLSGGSQDSQTLGTSFRTDALSSPVRMVSSPNLGAMRAFGAEPATSTAIQKAMMRQQSNRSILNLKGLREFERTLSSRIYYGGFESEIRGCALLANPARRHDNCRGLGKKMRSSIENDSGRQRG